MRPGARDFSAAGSLLSGAPAARAHDDAQVVRPGGTVAGKSIGEWTGLWWKTAIESVEFPFPNGVSEPGQLGDVGGPVFFGVASPGPGSTTYTHTVPRGKHILLPLYIITWTFQLPTEPCATLACARDVSDAFVYGTTRLSASVDGNEAEHLFRHYEATPHLFRANAPVEGWWTGGDPTYAGLTFGFDSGYWLMVKPLKPGKHVIVTSVKAPYTSSEVCNDDPTPCPDRPEPARTRLQ